MTERSGLASYTWLWLCSSTLGPSRSLLGCWLRCFAVDCDLPLLLQAVGCGRPWPECAGVLHPPASKAPGHEDSVLSCLVLFDLHWSCLAVRCDVLVLSGAVGVPLPG